jgi:hypothetical protein
MKTLSCKSIHIQRDVGQIKNVPFEILRDNFSLDVLNNQSTKLV